MTVYIHFLHGFLGLSEDWSKVTSEVPFQGVVHSLDDFALFSPSAFVGVASQLNQRVSAQFVHGDNIFVGYSLGGRLGLHSLNLQHPWTAAVFISVNPGLTSATEKEKRIVHDAAWAERFQTESWSKVTRDWDAQSVFAGLKNNLPRREEDFKRTEVARLLTSFSLGKQENLRPQIVNVQIPILWMSGALDTKFTAIAQEMGELNPNIQTWTCPDAGHRVPWENTDLFVHKLNEFITSVVPH